MLTNSDIKAITKIVQDNNKSLENNFDNKLSQVEKNIDRKLLKIERKLDKAINF